MTIPQQQAAELLARDSQTDAEIAALVGVSQTTIDRWKRLPLFAARVAEIRQQLASAADAARAAAQPAAFAIIENRVALKQRRLEQLEEIRRCRAAAAVSNPELLAQGGGTGLVITVQKALGKSGIIATDYVVDTDSLRIEMALQDGIAKDLGQHIQRQEVSGNQPVQVTIAYQDTAPQRAGDGEE